MIRFNCPHCQREYQLPAALAGLPLVCKSCSQRFVPATLPPAPEPPPPPAPAPKIERSILPPPAAPAPKAERPKPVAPPPEVPKPVAPEPKANVPAPPKAEDTATTGGDVLVSKPDSTPDIDFNVGGPTAASLSDAARQRPKGLSGAEVALPTTGTDTERDAASVPELDLEGLAKAQAQSRARLELPVPKQPRSEPRSRTEPELELPRAQPKREPRRVPPAPQPEPEPVPEPAARSELIPFAADLFALVVLLAGGMLVGEMIVKKHTGAILADAAETPLDALVWAVVPLTLALVYLLLAGRGRSLGALARGR